MTMLAKWIYQESIVLVLHSIFFISLYLMYSRMNLLYERGNDANEATPRDLLEVSIGLVTRIRVKRFKEAFNGLFQDTWVNVNPGEK
jgi:hypothetical protein